MKNKAKLKGLIHPKIKIVSLITHPHVVPNRKTFVHLQNTNQDIFVEIQELSHPA